MSNRLLQLVERIGNLLRAEQRLAASSLQPVHLQILAYLDRANRYSDTSAALTEFLATTKGTVSQSLRVLERHGLVRRRSDDADRRVTHLVATARGRRLVAADGDRIAVASRSGTPQEIATAVRVLETLLAGLQAANGRRSFGVCRTCSYFLREGADRYRCGLTNDPLSPEDAEKICREHTPAD